MDERHTCTYLYMTVNMYSSFHILRRLVVIILYTLNTTSLPKGLYTLRLVVSHIPDLTIRGSRVMETYVSMCHVCKCMCTVPCTITPSHLNDILAGSEDQSSVWTVLDVPDVAKVLLQGKELCACLEVPYLHCAI